MISMLLSAGGFIAQPQMQGKVVSLCDVNGFDSGDFIFYASTEEKDDDDEAIQDSFPRISLRAVKEIYPPHGSGQDSRHSLINSVLLQQPSSTYIP